MRLDMKTQMKKHLLNRLVALAFLSSFALPGLAAEAKLTDAQINEINAQYPMPTGKMLGDACAACHGTLGAEFGEGMPPLAGMDRNDFIALMKAFKANDFPTVVMHDVAYVYSDAEIEAMADYFAAQPAQQWPHLNADGTVKTQVNTQNKTGGAQ